MRSNAVGHCQSHFLEGAWKLGKQALSPSLRFFRASASIHHLLSDGAEDGMAKHADGGRGQSRSNGLNVNTPCHAQDGS